MKSARVAFPIPRLPFLEPFPKTFAPHVCQSIGVIGLKLQRINSGMEDLLDKHSSRVNKSPHQVTIYSMYLENHEYTLSDYGLELQGYRASNVNYTDNVLKTSMAGCDYYDFNVRDTVTTISIFITGM